MYRTKYLPLAAYLLYRGYVLIGTEDGVAGEFGKVFTFREDHEDQLEDIATSVNVYYSNNAKVEPLAYSNELSRLKALIHNKQPHGN